MNGYRESDSPIISEKPSNKTDDNKPVAEKVEKRGLAERNPSKRNRNQAQSWIFLPNEMDRIRYAAQRNRRLLFVILIWWNVCASILEAGAQCISSARHASSVIRGVPSNRHSYREPLVDLAWKSRVVLHFHWAEIMNIFKKS
ncbi:MAG: hypothetical protein ISS63_14810 [Desulfobacteraceae bacterium]|nr:hypothetical protein [Desulfobacteraceae bacterium]